MASLHLRTTMLPFPATLLLACALASPALVGCSKKNEVAVNQGNACTVDADCADDGEPCTIEKCREGICSAPDLAADGSTCPEGQCWAGACCTGCWDAASSKCEKGLTDSARCGVGGKACTQCVADGECLAGATCEAGQCVQKKAADSTSCGMGVGEPGHCFDGACCTTCVRSACSGPECVVGCLSLQQMTVAACGVEGLECKACPDDAGNPCTAPDCQAGQCTLRPLDGVEGNCLNCISGVCVVGMEGQPCAPTTPPSCDALLECVSGTCVKCGQVMEACCTGAGNPYECGGGYSCANGTCCDVDAAVMQTDWNNCGSCRHKCADQLKNADTFSCTAGQCLLLQCLPNYFDIDSDPSNGCEPCSSPFTLCTDACVDVKSNIDNCGGCGIQCTAPASCVSSNCSCAAPMLLCGNTCTDPRSDPLRCGSCSTVCPDTSMCAGSTCQPAAIVVVDSTEGVDPDAGSTGDIQTFAVDGSTVYYARGLTLYKRPLGGGASVKLLDSVSGGVFQHIQALGGRVFFALDSPTTAGAAMLSSVLPDGTGRVDYATQQTLGQSIANYVVGATDVVWLPRNPGLQGMEIRRTPIGGGMAAGPYATGAWDFGICQDLILYAEQGGMLFTRRIGEAVPSGLPTTIMNRLIVGATSDAIVFVADDGAVYRVPVATRQAVLIAPANVFPPNGIGDKHLNAGLMDTGKLVYPAVMTSAGQTALTLFSLDLSTAAIAPRARFPQLVPAGNQHRFGSFGGKVYFWGGDPPDKIYGEP